MRGSCEDQENCERNRSQEGCERNRRNVSLSSSELPRIH